MEQQLRPRGLTLGQAGVDTKAAVAIVNDVLSTTQADPPAVDADTRLDELGLDSLDFAELFVALEEAAGGEIDPQSTVGLSTVADLPELRRL